MFSKNNVKTYYEILNIDKSATFEQIKSAYCKKALNLHPDKNPHRETKAESRK